jgi:hypothetical protein
MRKSNFAPGFGSPIALRLMRRVAFAAFALLLPSAAQAVDPEFASFCNRYADDAVQQAKKNTEMKCGLEKENPDRWTSDRQAHFDWCISWDGAFAEPAREGSYRVVGLKDCAAKEAMQQGGVLSDRPGAKDVITTTTPPPPPPPPQVTVLLDVDICPTTAGCDEQTRLGVLPAGTQGVTIVENKDPWYHIKWQGPEGLVYSGEGYVSLKLP